MGKPSGVLTDVSAKELSSLEPKTIKKVTLAILASHFEHRTIGVLLVEKELSH